MDSDLHIKLISTDFDGTLFAEFENPAIPPCVTEVIGGLQRRGAKWVINTGRDMSSLMEALARAGMPIQPDYLVLVEREIHSHEHSRFIPLEPWNNRCQRQHEALFTRVKPRLPEIIDWIESKFTANIYSDPWSPFCLIAGTNGEADEMHRRLEEFCAGFPELVIVRNDVYIRFGHAAFNKGTALSEIGRLLGVTPEETFAAGDHYNDLPMLLSRHAAFLAAPGNAIPMIQESVRNQGGWVSQLSHGYGTAEALEHFIRTGRPLEVGR